MASVQLKLKREATVQGVSYLVNSITGQDPVVVRKPDGVKIKWHPGQASKLTDYLLSLGKTQPLTESGVPGGTIEEGLNVDVSILPVIVPFVIKKYWLYAAGWTIVVVGLTKLVSK